MLTKHETLQAFVQSLIKGNNTCLIIRGDAGIGKSETVLNTLHKMGYEKDKHFTYMNNYSAPRSFYDFLRRTQYLKEPRIIVLDDIEESLKQPKIVAILKGSLWAVDGKRSCSWISGNKESNFEFNGKIIIILNQFDEKVGLMNTLKDRSLYFEIGFSPEEIEALILKRAEEKEYNGITKEVRLEIAEYVIQNVRNRKLSLRDLQKTFDLYLGSNENWKYLLSQQNGNI